MAVFTITDLVLKTTNNTRAFESDTPGIIADSLTVNAGAYLITEGTANDPGDAAGAYLAATGAWTVKVSGGIQSENDVGIYLESGIVATSTITITADGEVGGGDAGIYAGSAVTITNAGFIGSTDATTAVIFNNTGKNTLTN